MRKILLIFSILANYTFSNWTIYSPVEKGIVYKEEKIAESSFLESSYYLDKESREKKLFGKILLWDIGDNWMWMYISLKEKESKDEITFKENMKVLFSNEKEEKLEIVLNSNLATKDQVLIREVISFFKNSQEILGTIKDKHTYNFYLNSENILEVMAELED